MSEKKGTERKAERRFSVELEGGGKEQKANVRGRSVSLGHHQETALPAPRLADLLLVAMDRQSKAAQNHHPAC